MALEASCGGDQEVAEFTDEVDGACGKDETAGRGDGLGFGEGGVEMGGGVGGDVEAVGLGEEVVDVGGAGVCDRGEDDVVVAALGVGGGGVEEGEEDLSHFGKVFVAEAGEEEGAGLGGGELGDGGAEGPGAGGIMSDVEKELVGVVEGDGFEAAGPMGVADTGFDSCIWYFVTFFVT